MTILQGLITLVEELGDCSIGANVQKNAGQYIQFRVRVSERYVDVQ